MTADRRLSGTRRSGSGPLGERPTTQGMLLRSFATVAAAAALGPAAPAEPIHSAARADARGTVILIHGGAWMLHGREHALREHERHAARLNRLGFDTVAITYRPGHRALGDVVAFYDRLRARLGTREPICALGDSAGGHLALMLAARRATLDCAIARGAPTDLRAAHGVWREPVARELAPYAPLPRISPVTYAGRLAGRVLASQARRDPVVGIGQLARLRRAGRGRVATMVLPPGGAGYVHAHVSPAALARLERAEARLLARAAR